MAKRFPRFLISLKNWLFPSPEDQDYLNKQTGFQGKEKTDQNTYYPRLQKQNSPEPRVIHQYPKKGNFRFPVIKDEEPSQKSKKIKKPSAPVRKSSEKRSFTTHQSTAEVNKTEHKEEKPATGWKETERQKPRFQGKDFSVRSVPSPVYGFNKPPVRKQNIAADEESRDDQGKQEWIPEVEAHEQEQDFTRDYTADRPQHEIFKREDFLPPSSSYVIPEEEKGEFVQNEENETKAHIWNNKEESETEPILSDEENESEIMNNYEENEAEIDSNSEESESEPLLGDEENEETSSYNEEVETEPLLPDEVIEDDQHLQNEVGNDVVQKEDRRLPEYNSGEEDTSSAESAAAVETEMTPSQTPDEQSNRENDAVSNSISNHPAGTTAEEEASDNQSTEEEAGLKTISAYTDAPARTEDEEATEVNEHSANSSSGEAKLATAEENTSNPHSVSRKKDKNRKDRHTNESTSSAAAGFNKEKEKRQGKIPFNVLMNRTDRIKVKRKEEERKRGYAFPSLQLLDIPPKRMGIDDEWVTGQVSTLNETFDYFRIRAKVVHVTKGPSVTRFEIQPEPGVKVSKITNLTDDLKLSLAAKEIRIEAPIPGKNTIGIEVPNKVSEPVFLREILHHKEFRTQESPLTAALGMDITGEPVVTDLQKMPHGLIAGATGSGKSVCVNSILVSLLYKASPKEVRLLLIDPKMVELAPYNGIPHLAAPVITDPKEATEGLKWAVGEMERRYELFAKEGSRDLKRFNKKMKEKGQEKEVLPYLVVVVDELADLMMVAPHDVEEAICRLAQKARACGIHLLVATQRPSVDVITGLIKSNIPTRIAFSVSSQADSRTIIDSGGAERLLGRGDMLFMENGSGKPVRIQGTFVSDEEIDRVMEYVKQAGKAEYLFERENLQRQIEADSEDDLFEPACDFVYEQQAASASLLQRHFRIGYNRAARLIDEMEERGIISSAKGSKPREVYLTKEGNNGKIGVRGDN